VLHCLVTRAALKKYDKRERAGGCRNGVDAVETLQKERSNEKEEERGRFEMIEHRGSKKRTDARKSRVAL